MSRVGELGGTTGVFLDWRAGNGCLKLIISQNVYC